MTDTALHAFENLLRDHIPLAAAMQARLTGFDGEALTVHAPLSANHNHYGTAFGGSLYTVALTAGWALASLLLDAPAQVVVDHAEADYQRPVAEDLVAVARPAGDADAAAFAAAFADSGRARLNVEVSIAAGGRRAFTLTARFVARPPA